MQFGSNFPQRKLLAFGSWRLAARSQQPLSGMAFLPVHKNPCMTKHNLNGSGLKSANGHVAAPSEDLQKNMSAFAVPVAGWPEDDLDEEEEDDLDVDDLDVDEVEVVEEVEVEEEVEVTDPDVEDLDEDLDLEEDEEEDDL
jgi:hypothetical protein